MTVMKAITIIPLIALSLSGCVMKETKTDRRGVVTEEKYVIKRPVKEALENMEVE
jgi:hypothetical protein